MKHDRKLHGASGQACHGRPKRVMSVQQALEWAFRIEHAQLELPEPPDPERGQGFGFGLEYVLMQRAALGCKIDGGQYKMGTYTHEDAEVIAATVAGMPDTASDFSLLHRSQHPTRFVGITANAGYCVLGNIWSRVSTGP